MRAGGLPVQAGGRCRAAGWSAAAWNPLPLPGRMTFVTRLTALVLVLMLPVAPAAWACGDLGTAAPACPMSRSMGSPPMGPHSMGAPSMGDGSMGVPDCHQGGQMAMDCCTAGPGPAPTPAPSAAAAAAPAPLEDGEPMASPPSSAPEQPASPAAKCRRLRDPGRYTLFAAFLL